MIIHSECLSEMRKMESNSISAIVTDPPYGLKFMGKEWDHGIPGVEFWKEALRISKPGTWMLTFGGTRTYHRLTCAIEDAGWEIRDCIMWMYGSGFPKGKGCLKPAYEPIVLARKKSEKVSDNFLNIDECRVQGIPRTTHNDGNYAGENKIYGDRSLGYQGEGSFGRWPSNVILDEEAGVVLDEQSGFSKSPSGMIKGASRSGGILGKNDGHHYQQGHNDSGGASRFFYCAKASPAERNEGLEGMPAKENSSNHFATPRLNDLRMENEQNRNPKQNFHPTVKPLKLMEYLIKLIMPKDLSSDVPHVLLDPFAGSGTTILAAKRLGIEAIGIELNDEYCEIARNRLLNVKEDPQMNMFT